MRHIRRLAATVIALSASSFAFATIPGPYLGVGVGQGQVQTIDKYIFNISADPKGSQSKNRYGTTWRGFAGYNINKFVGLEFGYAKYNRSIYVGRASGAYSSLTYYIHTYEGLLKGYLPLGDSGFNLYALAGFARVVETMNFINNGVPLNNYLYPPANGNNHYYRNRPEYGLGINYNFAKHFTVNVEATQILKLGSMSTQAGATPNLNFFSLNFAYNFC
jgi:hypothetical protein